MAKLELHDTGNNENFSIKINNQELDCRHCFGYELKRTSDNERVELKVLYSFQPKNCKLYIKNSDTEIKKVSQ